MHARMVLRWRDGEVTLTAAAASLSDELHGWLAAQPHASVAAALPSFDIESNAPTLELFAAVSEALALRVCGEAAPEQLKRAPFQLQLSVWRIAAALANRPVKRLASIQIAELLRGRSAEVLRIALNAADDLSAAEKGDSLTEPLLCPPVTRGLERA